MVDPWEQEKYEDTRMTQTQNKCCFHVTSLRASDTKINFSMVTVQYGVVLQIFRFFVRMCWLQCWMHFDIAGKHNVDHH